SELATRLEKHRVGPKAGPGIIAAWFDGRGKSVDMTTERGLVILDIEPSKKTGEVPPPPQVVAHRLMQANHAGVVYSTHSHQPNLPHIRIVMPLSAPIPLTDAEAREMDRLVPWLVAAELQLDGVLDTSKCGAASLMYAARHAEGASYLSIIVPGAPIST